MAEPPKHWKDVSWEVKAQENPMFAVMTTDEMVEAPPTDFSPEQLDVFFDKGRRVFDKRIHGILERSPDPLEESLVVEYGCGMGRLLKPVIEAGARAAGIDISPTMLDHCRRLVPQVEALYLLDKDGRCAMPDHSASALFSFAVVQHIASLEKYLVAFDEMSRILKPGGRFAIQVNCTDFFDGFDNPGRTENFETYSLHYRPGETEPFRRHDQDHWSGVYIGHQFLTDYLARRQMRVYAWVPHKAVKPLAVWIQGRKRGAVPPRETA